MKQYRKPAVTLELFDLDGEFAGCSMIPQDEKDKYFSIYESYMPIILAGDGETIFHSAWDYNLTHGGSEYETYEDFVNDAPSAGEEPNSNFSSVLDNFFMYKVNESYDDPTSDYCFFTFNSAKGKSFS